MAKEGENMPIPMNNPPTPKILINSIRQIGYSFESAVADIIDNSISVRAKNVDIFFPVNANEALYIAFLDDGEGMNRAEVLNAMKIGSNFEGERNENDLGRFGLGLKSASFSQCRKLTVISKQSEVISGFGWDITEVENSNEWNCYEYFDDEIALFPQISKLKSKTNGTLVIWSDFDLIEAKLEDSDLLHRQISKLLEQAREHISLVFHRFLSSAGQKKMQIRINNDQIVGLDPFLENHPKIEKKKEATFFVKTKNNISCCVRIQPYILPHYSNLSDEDRELLGGAEKMRDAQGFYIYRNDRLIIYGTWFRLRVKSEIAKYAKIKVDIPNKLDDIWEIDIKKQKAVIPHSLLAHFKKAIDDICVRSERKTSHKARLGENDDSRIWNKKFSRSGKESYYINLDAKFIKEYIAHNFDDLDATRAYRLLEIIGGAIPFDDIYNSVCNQSIELDVDAERELMVVDEAVKMIKRIAEIRKVSVAEAAPFIINDEPFNQTSINQKVREALGI